MSDPHRLPQRADHRDIAIIGLGCRFPHSPSPAAFWNTLIARRNTVTEVPAERWSADRFYNAGEASPGKTNSKWGAFLDRIEDFDAAFFRISPREAKSLDPQQRLLLEVAWEALEHAGQPHEAFEESATGVYVGICVSEYGMISGNDPEFRSVDKYFGTGTALSVAAGRISYCLNLRGAAVAIDTACSSSLVALHHAVGALRLGECDLCLAGGVNLMLSPAVGIYFSQIGAVSNSAECKAFDAAADGYVRGEGCGMVVLKRLQDALRDGDRVLAVIEGTAVNQDGRSAGLTAPNGAAQEAVIRAALRDGGIDPGAVDYVEAHGTGTRLGDPIEAGALGRVYGASRKGNPLLVGSVKTNLGHLEAAAGVAGLIKAVLALDNGRIPPQIHLREPNPLIPWDALNLRVASEESSWRESPARAGISSFGFSGTNAHVVVASGSHRLPPASPPTTKYFVLPLSARAPAALDELLTRCIDRLERVDPGDRETLAAVCRGWAVRRGHHPYRYCAVGRDVAELTASLTAGRSRLPRSGADATRPPGLAFVFSGQGSQWLGMASAALADEVAHRVLSEIDRLVVELAGWSLLEALRSPVDCADDVHVTQVCLFAMQVALARRWQSLGVMPGAVLGHSMGEIAAAHVAGALDLTEATRLSVLRSRLLSEVAGQGGMAVAELPEEVATERVRAFEGRIAIAGNNTRSMTIFSGEGPAIDELVTRLESEGTFCRRIRTSGVAGHSPLVAHLGPRLAASIADIAPREGEIEFVSSVYGEAIPHARLTADYWVKNLLEPVRFATAVEFLARAGYRVFLETSPKPTLQSAIERGFADLGEGCVALAALHPDHEADELTGRSLATLYESGVRIDWRSVYPDGRWEPAPPYPWQRERHWFTDLEGSGRRQASTPPTDADLARLQRWDCAGVRSLNMPNLAPWILVTPDRDAAFYIGVRKSTCIAWAYLGPPQEFARHVRWLKGEGASAGLGLLVLADDDASAAVADIGLESCDIGVAHTVPDLAAFSLNGAETRKLRSLVQRYSRESGGRTAEYRPGERADVDARVLALIDDWQALKGRAIRAAERLKSMIRSGNGCGDRRLFVTAAGNELHSLLLLTPFGDGSGCLLDMEFYTQRSPAGCNEYAITRVIEQLAAEGCRILSLGGSYGLQASADNRSSGVSAFSRQLRFKRKFRPLERRIVAFCEPASRDAHLDDLLDLFADQDAGVSEHRLIASLTALPKAQVGPPVAPADRLHPFLHRRLSLSGREIVFAGAVSAADPLIAQHTVDARPIVPGALFIDIALAGTRLVVPQRRWALRDLMFLETLSFDDGAPREIQLVITPTTGDRLDFVIASSRDGGTDWVRHVEGAAVADPSLPSGVPRAADAEREVNPGDFYAALEAAGIGYGSEYRALTRLRQCDGAAEAELRSPVRRDSTAGGFYADPAWIDGILQAAAAIGGIGDLDAPVVLRSIEECVLSETPATSCVVTAIARSDPGPTALPPVDIYVRTLDGAPVAVFRGVMATQLRARDRRPARPEKDAPDVIYTLQWRECALARPRAPDRPTLLVGQHTPLMDAFRAELAASRTEVRTVVAPDRETAITRLEQARSSSAEVIVWLPDATSSEQSSRDRNPAAAIPRLVRSLAERPAGLELWIATSGVHRPGTKLAIDDAALWGAARVMRTEHPEWRCGLIDLDPLVADRDAAAAIAAITGGVGGGDCWSVSSRGVRAASLGRAELAQGATWNVSSDATYVVTGWSGGIGLTIVDWLARRGAAHVVLIARSAPSRRVSRALEECATRYPHTRFVPLEADVASRGQLSVALSRGLRGAPPPRGIFHAAGQLADGLLLRQTAEDFRAAMAAKVEGTWNLHEASLSMPLDAFVLFSSAVTLFAPPTQGAHAAACAAMDHIARHRRDRGLPALSVGWGPWSRVGKAAALHVGARLRDFGVRELAPPDNVAALERLLSSDATHAYVASVDWQRYRSTAGAADGELLADVAPPSRGELFTREPLPAAATARVPAPAELLTRIVAAVAETLMTRLVDVDPSRSLEQNGLDSIMTVELRERLGRELGARFPLVDFFRERSLIGLAERARAHLPHADVSIAIS
jgi:acyl transferase domain-containing protein/acyl carrier protein